MARPTDRTERCTDLDLLAGLREGYRNLGVTARVLGVPVTVVRRVAQGQAVSPEELWQLQVAWAKYQPAALKELAADVAADVGTEDGRELAAALKRLLRELERVD